MAIKARELLQKPPLDVNQLQSNGGLLQSNVLVDKLHLKI